MPVIQFERSQFVFVSAFVFLGVVEPSLADGMFPSGMLARAAIIEDGGTSVGENRYEALVNTQGLRTERRVGVGAQVAGRSGLAGALIELNLSNEHSFLTGFGGGPRYQTFEMGWKRNFVSTSIGPYIGVSYSHWATNGGESRAIENTVPGFLGTKYLSASEKDLGKFSKDFAAPNFGIQYNQLRGPYRGVYVFAEVSVLMEFTDFSPTPVGAVGSGYYF